MSDLLRKTDNMLRIGTIQAVDLSAKPAMVRVEVDEGVLSDWMPYAQSFVGETMLWCAPKVGTSGLVVSEGGDNRICRFFPTFYDGVNELGLTDNDFKILFKNGDYLHHSAEEGILTINSTLKTIVNTENAEVNSQTTVVNAEKADVNAPKITLNGDVLITQTLTVNGHSALNGGFTMNSDTGRIRGPVVGIINLPVIVNNVMTFNVDPILHGTSYLKHEHKDVKSGADNTGGVA